MTAATLGTATESSLFGILDKDVVRGLQNYAFDLKFAVVITPTDATQGAVSSINLQNEAGMKRVIGITGWAHTTNYSVIVSETPATTIDNGVLQITAPSENDQCRRVYLIIGV